MGVKLAAASGGSITTVNGTDTFDAATTPNEIKQVMPSPADSTP
jgi:hypothetical protein